MPEPKKRFEDPVSWGNKQKEPESSGGRHKSFSNDKLPGIANEPPGSPGQRAYDLLVESFYDMIMSLQPPDGVEITREFKSAFNAAMQALKVALALEVGDGYLSNGIRSTPECLGDSDGDVGVGFRSKKDVDIILSKVCEGISNGLPSGSVFGCAITDNSGQVFIVGNARPKDIAYIFKEASSKLEKTQIDITNIDITGSSSGKDWKTDEDWRKDEDE